MTMAKTSDSSRRDRRQPLIEVTQHKPQVTTEEHNLQKANMVNQNSKKSKVAASLAPKTKVDKVTNKTETGKMNPRPTKSRKKGHTEETIPKDMIPIAKIFAPITTGKNRSNSKPNQTNTHTKEKSLKANDGKATPVDKPTNPKEPKQDDNDKTNPILDEAEMEDMDDKQATDEPTKDTSSENSDDDEDTEDTEDPDDATEQNDKAEEEGTDNTEDENEPKEEGMDEDDDPQMKDKKTTEEPTDDEEETHKDEKLDNEDDPKTLEEDSTEAPKTGEEPTDSQNKDKTKETPQKPKSSSKQQAAKPNKDEIFPNDDPISTKINAATLQWRSFIPEDKLALITPYESLLAEDEGDTKAFHDDLRRLTRLAGRILDESDDSSGESATKYSKTGHTTDNWMTIIGEFYYKEGSSIFLSDEENMQFRIITLRLAHTSALALFKGDVKLHKTTATNASRAWHGAQGALGSWHACNEKGILRSTATRKTEAKQQKLGFTVDTKKAAANKGTKKDKTADKTASDKDKDTTKKDKTKTTTDSNKGINKDKDSSKSTSDGKKKSFTPASKAAEARTYCTRVTYAVKVEPEGKQTANEKALEIMKEMFAAMQKNDKRAILLPWAIADMDNHVPIRKPEDIPEKASEMRIYADRFRPMSDRTMWIKLHWACEENVDDFTSGRNSNTSDWFDDNGAKGFPCTVQDSDDPVELGVLLYSGDFVDPVRVENEIRKALGQRKYSFGCRIKKCFEIVVDKDMRPTDWIMADNRLIHIECDRKHARALKTALYTLYNKTDDRFKRPGQDNFRMLPAKTLIKSGPAGQRL